MKAKRKPIILRKPNLANPIVLPNAEWPGKQTLETVALIMTAKPMRKEKASAEPAVPMEYLKALVSIATNAWRAKTKMVDSTTGEVREEMKRIDRHIEAIYRSLAEVGIVIRDHTGDLYDEGQPMKVVASKPTPGIHKKRVSETLLPSIFWNNRLVQNGEIEIATPSDPNMPVESQPRQP
jgi:hypothetical protein